MAESCLEIRLEYFRTDRIVKNGAAWTQVQKGKFEKLQKKQEQINGQHFSSENSVKKWGP